MYCPRCGSQNPDTTKFCRQCGLALTNLSGYVASGGTAQLPQPPPTVTNPPNLVAKATEGLTPKQKMVLTILLLALLPAIFKVFGETTGLERLGEGLAKISAVLMSLGIVLAVMRYKAQKRNLEEAIRQQALSSPTPQPAMPPAAHYGLPQPTQQPIQSPVQQSPQQPVYHPPMSPSPPPTNPLPGSVTEEETRRLQ